jgi:nucleotide-binding universal stress UspA family protein
LTRKIDLTVIGCQHMYLLKCLRLGSVSDILMRVMNLEISLHRKGGDCLISVDCFGNAGCLAT